MRSYLFAFLLFAGSALGQTAPRIEAPSAVEAGDMFVASAHTDATDAKYR